MRHRGLRIFLASLLVACTSAIGAGGGETGQTIRAVELKGTPSADAATTASLPPSTHVEILKRHGAWLQVKAAAGSGWVRMLSVRGEGGPSKPASGGGSLKAFGNLLTTGSSGAPVATGVRGLDEADLKLAQPNPAELALLQGNAVDASQARKFAEQAKLKTRNVEYLAGATPTKGKKGEAK